MSAENTTRRRDRPGEVETATTDDSGISPLDISLRDLKKYRPRSQDDPAAGDVQDPHAWDDPDPGFVSRFTPDSLLGWIGSIAGLLIVVGLLSYLFPVFWPVIRNPIVIGLLVFSAYTLGVWLHGRQSGWSAFRRFTKSVIYLGDDVQARVGTQPEEIPGDGSREFFSPYRNVRFGGFRPRALLKRDLPFDPRRMRGKSPSVSGDDPVIDRLNATTIKLETDTLGTVLFTHGGALEYEWTAEVADRYVSLPETIDQGAVDDLQRMITSLQTELVQQQTRLDMLLESNNELRDLRTAQKLPEMEQAVEMIDRIGDKIVTQKPSRDRNGSDTLRRIHSAAENAGDGYRGDGR